MGSPDNPMIHIDFQTRPFLKALFFVSGEDSDYTCPSQVSTFMSFSIWPSWQQSNCERGHKNDQSRGLMDPTASVGCQPWPDAAALPISLHRESRIGALFSRFVLLDVYSRIAVRQQSSGCTIERSASTVLSSCAKEFIQVFLDIPGSFQI